MTVSVPVDPSKAVNALERRYRDWRATPEGKKIYALFRRFAYERLINAKRFGMKALAERVRWEASTDTQWREHEFKLNNNVVTYIGRDLIREFPLLARLIEVRRVKEED
jgi:hypothetical protein